MPIVVDAKTVPCPNETCAVPVGKKCRNTLHDQHFGRYKLALKTHREKETQHVRA